MGNKTFTKHIQQLKDSLQQRLLLPLPGISGQKLMLPMGRVIDDYESQSVYARPSAVLLMLYPSSRGASILLIKRTEDGKAHSGQISFPGGKFEEADQELIYTALRETHEEIGIQVASSEVMGRLSPLFIPVSQFKVHPFVAVLDDLPKLHPNPREVENVLALPLRDLLSTDTKTIARITSPTQPGFVRKVPAYQLENGDVVWGATAMILAELETILTEINLSHII
jgi:8-oxo-dGTP pyrophosphatase MutT (NUDIX family)